jgi:hypothetical protein
VTIRPKAPRSPPYVSGSIGRIFIVRWRHYRLADVAIVKSEIAELRRLVGGRLVYLSLIPDGAHTFSAYEIDALSTFVRELLERDCESIHHVVAGEGFVASARRSLITKIALESARPKLFHVYESLDEALGAIARARGESKQALLEDARARGLDFET